MQDLHGKNVCLHTRSTASNFDQKLAQTLLIDTMTTLLTGIEPRLDQLIRAGTPKDFVEAHVHKRREQNS